MKVRGVPVTYNGTWIGEAVIDDRTIEIKVRESSVSREILDILVSDQLRDLSIGFSAAIPSTVRREPGNITITDSTNVQFGNGNTQVNHF